MICEVCGNKVFSQEIKICPKCSKTERALEIARKIHMGMDLIGGGDCNICSNRCKIETESLCRLRKRENNRILSLSSKNEGLLHAYYDRLPTNCCNGWFCRGNRLKGFNLALFYYGCNFDCLFCQNWTHKNVEEGRVYTVEELLGMVIKDVKCICHFGGSPEPQIDFAIKFSRESLKLQDVMICWEWNGAGKREKVLEAGKISHESGGTVKFDLKAWNENLHILLTGRSNSDVLKNFEALFHRFPEVVSATTLLIPYYIDAEEVENIARFLSSLSDEIPYSLLVFHPDYRLKDLPVTPKNQVIECYRRAKKYLKNVNIGNLFLLGL